MAGSQRHSIAEQRTEDGHVEQRCGRRCEEAVQWFIVLKQWRPPFGKSGAVERKPSTLRASAPLGVYSNNDISRALGETDGLEMTHEMNVAEHHRPLEAYFSESIPDRTVPHSGPELSIIVPTFNERENIAELIGRLVLCLGGRSWE